MTFFQSKLLADVTTADIPDILTFVEDACQEAGVEPGLWFDLQLVVEEACTNVIEHAYQGRGGVLGLHFETRNSDVVITVCDRGRAFDPNAVARPNTSISLHKRPIGGLGLHLMYQLMDDVRFSFESGGNTLMMMKRDAVIAAPDVALPEQADV